ncbi:MAG: hypothetical protein OXC19_00070 [Bryobacterales bacterium]|nr:hypothetical protein [Bryobacterales bacterium]
MRADPWLPGLEALRVDAGADRSALAGGAPRGSIAVLQSVVGRPLPRNKVLRMVDRTHLQGPSS